MNNRMFDSTMNAMKLNVGSIGLSMERIGNLPVHSENYEDLLKREIDVIATVSERIKELTIVAKASITIG